jgi:mannose/fructose-specific phosphotransferase system component IIA
VSADGAAPGETPNRVPALIITHADLAQGLVHAAERVVGPVEDVTLLSNEGLSRDDLEDAIESRVQGWLHGGLLLTDFWGGSCHICGAAAARGKGSVTILTGINLPLLLDYLHNRDQFPLDELAERLKQKGQDSIRVQRGQGA